MKLIHKKFDTLSSTQDEIKKYAAEIIEERFLLCTANKQTNARGTKKRTWLAPSHTNIYASYGFLFPRNKSQSLLLIPQIAAYCVVLTLKALNISNVSIKWVNDVFVNHKKICGILAETNQSIANKQYFIVYLGIGFNINMSDALCDSLEQPVTSLKASTGREYDIEHVLTLLNANILTVFLNFIREDFKNFHSEISDVLEFKNETILFDTESNHYEPSRFPAKVIGIDRQGAIILEPTISLIRDELLIQKHTHLTFLTGRILR
jgi:BirA family transcriptional regulator, biotin operon repressor / biotin---[acetyl-CoA-carboxylase] ligase